MGDPTFPLNYPLRDERVQRLGRLGRRRKRFGDWDGRQSPGLSTAARTVSTAFSMRQA